MFNQIGPLEVVVVLAIVLLIFGPKRLPAAGRALGESMRGFKDSISGKGKDDPGLEPPQAAGSDDASAPAAKATGAEQQPAERRESDGA